MYKETTSTTRSTMQYTKRDVISHILIWIALIVYLFLIAEIDGPFLGKVIYSGIIYLNYLFAFYSLLLFALPRHWQTNKVRFFYLFTLTTILYYSFGYWDWYIVYPIVVDKTAPVIILPQFRFISTYSLWYFFICLVVFSYFFRKLKISTIKKQNEKETTILKKELYFLKNQLNPHITFNFLNHLYSIANFHSSKTARAIEVYSDLFRYYTENSSESIVALESEIKYINNYVELRKTLNKEVYVNFTCNDDLQDIPIYPRILITFVENAFKHGIYNKEDSPIEIHIQAREMCLKFNVRNLINKNKNIISSGVGLKNAKQILNIKYKDNYTLITEECDNTYSCSLELKYK